MFRTFSDGCGRTGTFICIHSQLERLKTEGVVDFFQAMKTARIQRPALIANEVRRVIYCIVMVFTLVLLLLFMKGSICFLLRSDGRLC